MLLDNHIKRINNYGKETIEEINNKIKVLNEKKQRLNYDILKYDKDNKIFKNNKRDMRDIIIKNASINQIGNLKDLINDFLK